MEDIVVEVISQLLGTEKNIQFLADKIYECHKNRKKDNANLKLLEQHRKEVYKSSQNMLIAIEQGIITDMTKTRLQQLESELAEIDIAINKEKLKDYSLITKEEINCFLRKQVFENMEDIKIRKLIVNTFFKKVYLYEDKIVILFNFTNPPDKPKLTIEENIQTAEQINSAIINTQSSCIGLQATPSSQHEIMI